MGLLFYLRPYGYDNPKEYYWVKLLQLAYVLLALMKRQFHMPICRVYI
jgi:hypothetical protein